MIAGSKLALLLVLGIMVTVSGCTTTTTEGEKGTLEIMVSDQQTDISDFSYLNVKLSEIRVFKSGSGFETYQPAVDSFDLTKLQGDNALSLINATLDEGMYTKIEFHVESVEGETADGEAEIMVPSDKLMITSNFEIEPNKTVSFVFDINTVKKGQTNSYNLLPVISESGFVGREIPEGKINRVTREEAKAHVKGQPAAPGEPPAQDQTPPAGPDSGQTGDNNGNLSLLVTDAPADIGDFSELIVNITGVSIHDSGRGEWLDFVPGVSSFDLTQLVDGNTLEVLGIELEAGRYTQVRIDVDSAVGLVDNETVEIKVPSNMLKIIKPFEITAGVEAEFVFDINVVRKGQSMNYNLLPVVGKSGVRPSGEEPVCGNDICEVGEDNATCPADCLEIPDNETVCGNDMIEEGEECDGIELANATCIDFGYTGGNISCTENCTLDLTECVNETNETVCGNDVCEEGEDYLTCPEDCEAPAPVCVPEINCTDYCGNNETLFINGTCVDDSCVFANITCEFGCDDAACLTNETNQTV